MKFYYQIYETRTGIVAVEASSTEEAEAKLEKVFEYNQIVFNDPDFIASREYEDISEDYMKFGWPSREPDESI
jgi:hypothetical protein